MTTHGQSDWTSEARRLARDDLGSQPWVVSMVRQVDGADDDDLGTMLVARAVLTKASSDRAAQRARQRAEETARREQESQRNEQERRERVVQNQQTRVGRHRGADGVIIGWGIGLSVTVLVPWLLGRYIFRDSFLLPTQASVPSEVRNYLRGELGGYFPADYLTGLAVVAFLVAFLCIVRPWRGRVLTGLLSIVLLAGSWYAHAEALTRWDEQEVLVGAEKIYPFPQSNPDYTAWNATEYLTCGMSNIVQLDGHNHYTWTASIEGSDLDRGECNLVYAYTDWTQRERLDLAGVTPSDDYPNGAVVDDAGEVCDTNGTAEGLLWHADDGDFTYSFRLLGDREIQYSSPEAFVLDYPMCQE